MGGGVSALASLRGKMMQLTIAASSITLFFFGFVGFRVHNWLPLSSVSIMRAVIALCASLHLAHKRTICCYC